MQSAIQVQSAVLDMSCLTAARHLPHRVLGLHCAETLTPASQLKAHIKSALVQQFQENHILEQSACQVADRGLQQCPQ
jgi:hypothetical protein